MSKTIYEEALQELKDATTDLKDLEIIHSYDVSKIEQALERAQKQEKLLGLYKKLSFAWEERFDYNNGEQRIRDLQKQIKELENEL